MGQTVAELAAPEWRDPGFPDDAVEVGRIHGAWGVRGGVKVQPFSPNPQALFSSKRWFLRSAEGAKVPGHPCLRIVQAREQSGFIVAEAHDIADRDAAQALRGARVFVSRASFPTAPAGEHYWVDLIGLRVVNRQSEVLGEVVGLIETGVHCVLRVRPIPQMSEVLAAPSGRRHSEGIASVAAEGGVAQDRAQQFPASERLIPFVDAYIDEVDTDGRRIVVDWGLDY